MPMACPAGHCTPLVKLKLGQACNADVDCQAPAFCLNQGSDRFFGGGSALGVCVADCSSDPSTCSQFASAECVPVSTDGSGAALCFEACSFGKESADKCQNRDNLICDQLPGQSANQGFCRPICELDSDCGTRRCDRLHGVCVDNATEAGEFGKSCDMQAAASSCNGVCLRLTSDYDVCSHRCKFGQRIDCQTANGAAGACVFSATSGTLDDTGFCGQLCNCNTECSHAQAVCDPFGNLDLEQTFGKKGVCAPPALAQVPGGIAQCW